MVRCREVHKQSSTTTLITAMENFWRDAVDSVREATGLLIPANDARERSHVEFRARKQNWIVQPLRLFVTSGEKQGLVGELHPDEIYFFCHASTKKKIG